MQQPQQPGSQQVTPEQLQQQVAALLGQPVDSLEAEAALLSQAHEIVNDALK